MQLGYINIDIYIYNYILIGALEDEFIFFSFSWECHHHIIPTVAHSIIFQRGRAQPPTSVIIFMLG